MVTDDQKHPWSELPSAAKEGPVACAMRSTRCKVAAVVVAGVAVMAASGFLVIQLSRPPAPTTASAKPADANGDNNKPGMLFVNWPAKLDAALVLSAQQHGYLLPCGCSRPQLGGLERRYNFVQTLHERGWPVMALDLGDIPQRYGPQKLPNIQGVLKYGFSMKSLREIGYSSVTFGENEMALTLDEMLAQYALNNPMPRVLADNLKAIDNFPGAATWAVEQPKGSALKIGVVGVVGPTVRGKVQDRQVNFNEVKDVLPKILKDMEAKKPDVRVLLYQGTSTEARACAEAFPQLQVILCLSETEEPPGNTQEVGQTQIVTVGHKGRYVGVMGITRTGKADRPVELRYQLVPMSEDFLTAKDKEKSHPILALMEDYTKELKNGGYLQKYGQTRHPVQVQFPAATYVGSEACKKCHEQAYHVWEKSGHSHAYQKLVDARNPSLRQYDAECIVCHVTGFTYQGGFVSADKTPILKNVGCESCHGPGSLHVSDSKNIMFRAALNPWKKQPDEDEAKRTQRIDQFCQKCHDTDNDVRWTFEKWKDIEH